jgi:preprotein translocase subunit SecD
VTRLGTRGRVALAVVAVLATVVPAGSAGAAAASAGTLPADTLQFRPVLAAITGATTTNPPTADEAAAIASCDPKRVAALTEVPAANATSSRPHACEVRRFAAGEATGALYLGPARLTAADVRSARSTYQSGSGYEIVVFVTKAGKRKFNAMARDLFPQESPRNQVALVVGGLVYANPAFQTSSFSGPISISGNYTQQEAKRLARTINRARRGAH